MNPESKSDWRVGVLYSRSGVTSVTESEHFFGTALAIEEINNSGGILGKKLFPVVYDPKGDPDEYRRLATKMLLEEDINVIFGCSRSSSRKAVLPIVERTNGLLWYCSIYEGFEYSQNVIYTGAVPNQNSIQLAAYLLQNKGKRFYLIGSDYLYPRESNRIMRDMVESHGGEILDEIYLKLDAGKQDVKEVIEDISKIQPDVIFSTLVGMGAREFYKQYREQGLEPSRMPIASLTMAEEEIRMIGSELCEGHITSATYFGALENPCNLRFLALWDSKYSGKPASMWSEMAYNQVHLFAKGLERSGTLDTQKLVQAVHKVNYDSPEGLLAIDADSNHCSLTPRIGVCQSNGQFKIVWESSSSIKADPYLSTYGFAEFWLK